MATMNIIQAMNRLRSDIQTWVANNLRVKVNVDDLSTSVTTGTISANQILINGDDVKNLLNALSNKNDAQDATISTLATKEDLDKKLDSTLASETYVPKTRKINGIVLDKDITINATDPNAATKDELNALNTTVANLTTDSVKEGANKYFTNERAISALSGTLNNYVPNTIKINNKVLSSDITLSVSDISGAVSTDTFNALQKQFDDLTATGGEPNVQSNWDETNTNSDAFIKNKPDLSVYETTTSAETKYAPKSLVDTVSQLTTTVNNKQNTISDLEDIRSGANAGKTALQPSALNDYIKTTVADNKYASKDTVAALDESLHSVAKSGSYNDLTNKPTIPSAVTDTTVSNWGYIKETTANDIYAAKSVEDTVSSLQEQFDNLTASGGEPNVQSDWNVTNENLDSYIKNKPDLSIYETKANAANTYAPKSLSDTVSQLSTSIPSGIIATDLSSDENKATSNPYVKLNNKDGKIQIKGSGTVSVSSTVNGVITIHGDGVEIPNVDLSDYALKADLTSHITVAENTYAKKDELPTVNNGTLTIQKNGTNVGTFTANQSSEKTINITVPIFVSDLSDGSSYATQAYVDQAVLDVATGGNVSVPVKDVTVNGKSVVADKIAKIIVPNIKMNNSIVTQSSGTVDLGTVLVSAKAEAGNNINATGEPSVTVTTSGGVSTFTFNYLKGAKGDKGDTGEKGDKGDTGAKGDSGTNGVTPTIKAANGTNIGTVGNPTVTASTSGTTTTFTFNNLKGEKGDPGTNGTSGVGIKSVVQTTTSSESSGKNTITVTLTDNSTSTFSVYNGAKGTDGTDGINGTNGSTWYSGTSTPANSTGVVGDWYINTSTFDLYKKTASTTWTKQGNIKGADGSNGSAGSSGIDGTDGFNMLYSTQSPTGTGTSVSLTKSYIKNNTSLKVGDLVLCANGNLYQVTSVGTTSYGSYLTSLKGAAGSNGSDGSDGTNGTDGKSVSSIVCVTTNNGTTTGTPSTADDGTSYYRFKDSAGNWIAGTIAVQNGSKGSAGANGTSPNYYITGLTWKTGTTAGPTAEITRQNTSGLTVNAFPAATAFQSGVVTTAVQTFAGNKTFTGTVSSVNGFYETSDERLKNFTNDVEIDFEKLIKLPKKYFTWKSDTSDKLQLGTSAQAVQEIYPELVKEQDGILSVAYDKLSIVALKAVDELYNKNKELEFRLERLEKLLNII